MRARPANISFSDHRCGMTDLQAPLPKRFARIIARMQASSGAALSGRRDFVTLDEARLGCRSDMRELELRGLVVCEDGEVWTLTERRDSRPRSQEGQHGRRTRHSDAVQSDRTYRK